MKTKRIEVTTGRDASIVDLTPEATSFVQGEGDGLLNVSLPHATCGLALIELHSGSEEDLLDRVRFLLPPSHPWTHAHGSPGHGASHVLPAFLTPTLTLSVIGGRLSIGTWQSLALVDTNPDNSRREVLLAFLPSPG